MELLIAFLLILVISARPNRQSSLGDKYIKLGTTYKYKEDTLNGFNEGSKLGYSINIKPNIHSFDFDESIESVKCKGDNLVVSTNNRSIETWSKQSLVTGSNEMWNCSCSLNRKIKKSFFEEYFNQAEILYKPTIDDSISRRTEYNNFKNVIFKVKPFVDTSNIKVTATLTKILKPINNLNIKEDLNLLKKLPFIIDSPLRDINLLESDVYCVSYSLLKGNKSIINQVILTTYELQNFYFLHSNKIIKRYISKMEKYVPGNIYTTCFKIDNNYQQDKSYLVTMKMKGYYEVEINNFYVEKPESSMSMTQTEAKYVDYTQTKRVTVEWDYLNKTNLVDLIIMKLKRYKYEIDETNKDDHYIIEFTKLKEEFVSEKTIATEVNCTHYFKLINHCLNNSIHGNLCLMRASSFFTNKFSDISGELEIETPILGTSYKTGDNIIVTWSCRNYSGDKDLYIKLMRHKITATFVYSVIKVKANDTGIKIKVPKLEDGTNYFIQMESVDNKIKKYAFSDFFYINHVKIIDFYKGGIEYDTLNKQLFIKFKTISHTKLENDSFITIKQDFPMYITNELPLTNVKYRINSMNISDKITHYEYSLIINHFDSPSIFYICFSYDCKNNDSICHSEYSQKFRVSSGWITFWNVNEYGIIEKRKLDLVQIKCKECFKINKISTGSTFCKWCKHFYKKKVRSSVKIRSTCEGCYLYNDIKVGPIQVDIGPTGIKNVNAHFVGHLGLNLNVKNFFKGKLKLKRRIKFLKLPFFRILPINLGIIPLNFGVDLDSGIVFDLKLTGSIGYKSITQMDIDYAFDLSYPLTKTNINTLVSNYTQVLNKKKIIFDPLIDTNADAKLTITPFIGISLSTPLFKGYAKLKFPFVNKISYNNKSFRGTNDSSIAPIVKNLENDHYFEYTTSVKGLVDIGFKLDLILYKKKYSTSIKLFGPINLLKAGFIDVGTSQKIIDQHITTPSDYIKEYKNNTKECIEQITKDIIKHVYNHYSKRIKTVDLFVHYHEQKNISQINQSTIFNIKTPIISCSEMIMTQLGTVLNVNDFKCIHLTLYSKYKNDYSDSEINYEVTNTMKQITKFNINTNKSTIHSNNSDVKHYSFHKICFINDNVTLVHHYIVFNLFDCIEYNHNSIIFITNTIFNVLRSK
ncbi:hypothetical protein EDI_203280 [Entamoeba dispar SAW760]|uniref:Yeast cell wall synthesis Kre9/Knh1-like N-terminal domain-containing protein n=1 Tax=Entamoeba dispar (strain ATCC PRA-260 / SAW760) TaxID=370354 RepID=B0E5C8_ENTDS|nr:uncharacterized protein EDI_203280 [Entamoeba dispar SAW760]EDR30261.1 hypothetical protein EDI_203280 [Entamoeba dispar SAW760]|eukprot:EDR30261.1 hypothetical protein EDI_203280 [Entamoeba dispar SAW760]